MSRLFKRKKFHISNLDREEERIKKRAIYFGFLTIILIFLVIFLGIPLFIKFLDFIGNIKSKRENITVEDTIPPSPFRLSPIPEATNSGTLSIDGFTDPKTKVIIKFNGSEIITESNNEGKIPTKILNLEFGSNRLSAIAIDEAGNKSPESETLEIIYDNQPPELIVEAPEEGEKVEEQTIEVKGNLQEDCRVLVNDHLVIVDSDGKFSTNVILKEGENTITILAQDKAGNKTEKQISVIYMP